MCRLFATGLDSAARIAIDAIRANKSILSDVNLEVLNMKGGCDLDNVMKTFINYYVRPERVLGVLGPPCSETVEPIAGN